MRPLLLTALLFVSSIAFGGTTGIGFVYQPLTTLGTDQESEIIIARVPVIAGNVTEGVMAQVSAKNKLLQQEPAAVDDSNLLSCLAITVSAEWMDGKQEHYVVTLDLSKMKSTEDYELTADAVVKAAVQCIRRTIDELGEKKLWKIRITPRPQDAKTLWKKYESDYRPKPSK